MSFAAGFPDQLASLATSGPTLEQAYRHAIETAAKSGLEHAFVRLGCISEIRDDHSGPTRIFPPENSEDGIAQPESLTDAKRKLREVSQNLVAMQVIARQLKFVPNKHFELSEARSTVEDVSTALAKSIRQGQQYSIATSTIQNLCRILDVAVNNHDALLSKHLFDANSDFDILATVEQTASRLFVKRLDCCERCSAPTELWRISPLMSGAAEASEILCPICGHRDFFFLECDKLEVVADKFVCPGHPVNVHITRTGERPTSGPPVGWLITTLREKSQGSLLAHRRDRMGSEPIAIRIDVPTEAPSDMLTLKVIWIGELSISSSRRRIVSQRS
jgi:DNA-binding Xre family transcriptional regulator